MAPMSSILPIVPYSSFPQLSAYGFSHFILSLEAYCSQGGRALSSTPSTTLRDAGCLQHAPLKVPKLELWDYVVVVNIVCPLWSYDVFSWRCRTLSASATEVIPLIKSSQMHVFSNYLWSSNLHIWWPQTTFPLGGVLRAPQSPQNQNKFGWLHNILPETIWLLVYLTTCLSCLQCYSCRRCVKHS